MSDLPTSDPTPEPPAVPSGEAELEVDLAAFLPEGVVIGEEAVLVESDGGTVLAEETVIATDDEIVVIDEVVAVVAGEVDGPDEAVATDGDAAAEAPAVDLEALSQIERDLDAVDAAIAALDAGTYGIDPATGSPLDDALLAEDPTRLS